MVKRTKQEVEQLLSKIKAVMEPYAIQLQNLGLIVQWSPSIELPDYSGYTLLLNDERYLGSIDISSNLDLNNFKYELSFEIRTQIREIKDTSISKKGLAYKQSYDLMKERVYKEKDFKVVLDWTKYLVKKFKEIKQEDKLAKMKTDF